jgi:DNA-binding XRE family transcriptional regulator
MNRKIIERNGERFVLVPEKTYAQMIDDLDDLDDIRAYDRAKTQAQEFVPAEIADRLIAGESPVRVWREYRRMTQQALADQAGISKPFLLQIETGAREASVGVLQVLAGAVNVDLDDIAPAHLQAKRAPKATKMVRRVTTKKKQA